MSGLKQQARVMDAVLAEQGHKAVRFKAWHVCPTDQGNPRNEAHQINFINDPMDAGDAAYQAAHHCLHKSALLLLITNDAERPERRHLLQIHQIKRKSRPGKRWNKHQLCYVNEHPEYPVLVTQFCVGPDFSPIEPWKWSPDQSPAEVVGADTTLIEGRST